MRQWCLCDHWQGGDLGWCRLFCRTCRSPKRPQITAQPGPPRSMRPLCRGAGEGRGDTVQGCIDRPPQIAQWCFKAMRTATTK